MSRYTQSARTAKMDARVTPQDRRLVEEAAERADLSLSAWLADRAVRAARLELPSEDLEGHEDELGGLKTLAAAGEEPRGGD